MISLGVPFRSTPQSAVQSFCAPVPSEMLGSIRLGSRARAVVSRSAFPSSKKPRQNPFRFNRPFSTSQIRVEESEPTNVIDKLVQRGLITAMTRYEPSGKLFENGNTKMSFSDPLGAIFAFFLPSPALRDIVEKDPKCAVYAGYDPTADSLHVGHIISIITLGHLQKAGLKPIAIVGGATGMIGDPSGRSEERPLLSEEQIQYNLGCLRETISGVLGDGVTVVNNYEWFKNMTAIELLRNVGKHFRMGTMLAKDSVKSRLDSEGGMSFTEFSYQLLQGYDFNYLFEHHNCKIQLGGADQWGNITAGIDLIHRLHREEAYGFTVPLLTTAAGVKIGKSMGNAVWISAHREAPYQLYQWAMRLDDNDIEKMLRLLTYMPLKNVSEVVAEHLKKPEAREGHKVLATEITKLVHGEKAAESAKQTSQVLFGGKLDTSIVRSSDLISAFKDSGCVTSLSKEKVVGGTFLNLANQSGVVASKAELKRLGESGGIYLNNNVIKLDHVIQESDVIDGKAILIRSGKKNYRLVTLD